ncbi:MAG: hypothetical protein KGL39_48490 [Patescibacteria group bacterium]|nr:hypothetical protein [Patescibacteria group bacterium]
MPELSRIGSGKPDGFCGSFTRRISDLREAGHNIVMTMEQIDGQRHTFYELVRQETQQELLQVN